MLTNLLHIYENYDKRNRATNYCFTTHYTAIHRFMALYAGNFDTATVDLPLPDRDLPTLRYNKGPLIQEMGHFNFRTQNNEWHLNL